jgi:hypothetical protein
METRHDGAGGIGPGCTGFRQEEQGRRLVARRGPWRGSPFSCRSQEPGRLGQATLTHSRWESAHGLRTSGYQKSTVGAGDPSQGWNRQAVALLRRERDPARRRAGVRRHRQQPIPGGSGECYLLFVDRQHLTLRRLRSFPPAGVGRRRSTRTADRNLGPPSRPTGTFHCRCRLRPILTARSATSTDQRTRRLRERGPPGHRGTSRLDGGASDIRQHLGGRNGARPPGSSAPRSTTAASSPSSSRAPSPRPGGPASRQDVGASPHRRHRRRAGVRLARGGRWRPGSASTRVRPW